MIAPTLTTNWRFVGKYNSVASRLTKSRRIFRLRLISSSPYHHHVSPHLRIAPSSLPRAHQMSNIYLLSVQDCSLNKLQIWEPVHGWIQSAGSGCSRLCNQPQVSTAGQGFSPQTNMTCLWHRYCISPMTHREDVEGNTMTTTTMPWCH
jgi:hypothetical protein